MDLRRLGWLVVVILIQFTGDFASGNFVFEVKHKFAGREKTLSAFKAHDRNRHARILSAVDLPLGGDSGPASIGLYFTKLGLGNPSKDYYVQVDTGSDIGWVNCAGCIKCPKKSQLGIPLTLFDAKQSSTSKLVACDDETCSRISSSKPSCPSDSSCEFSVAYGDGSSISGYFVKDSIKLDKVSGNLQTTAMNDTVVFGCGVKQSGQLGQSDSAVDGILGFGQANSSILSQLAAAGKVKRVFSHCLDNINGGGIFAIGDLVSPKVKTTPIVPEMAHYNVVLEAIDVGGVVLELPSDVFDAGDNKGTIIDSGTTLAYLPDVVYESMLNKILIQRPGLKLETFEEQFSCFDFKEDVDAGFPIITLHFEGSLTLKVYPHDYLFQIRDTKWCIGWQNGGQGNKDGKQLTLLGDLVLSNKLVMYDLENQVIGWTEYNCSSSIKVKDEVSGAVYSVGAQNISLSSRLSIGGVVTFLSILIILLHSFAF